MYTTLTNDRCKVFYGKSSDKKPTKLVGNGSQFIEIDTSKIYMYDEEHKV